jgi:hypothetical protein
VKWRPLNEKLIKLLTIMEGGPLITAKNNDFGRLLELMIKIGVS